MPKPKCRMSSKRAFMKTVEAFMAIIIVFSFITFFMPRDVGTTNDQSAFRLQHLERDEVFRECVLARNESCIEEKIEKIFEQRYSFEFSIYQFAEPDVEVDENNVNVYTWFFAGTQTDYEPTKFRLLYWDRDFDASNLPFLDVDEPSVETDSATAINATEATLNAELLDIGDEDQVDIYFRWREDGESEWQETLGDEMTAVGQFNETLDSLASQTQYEFRAIVEWPDGDDIGSILTFTTES